MKLEERSPNRYAKLALVGILLGISFGLPIWFLLTRWRIVPMIAPSPYSARFEWDREHGVRSLVLNGLPPGDQTGGLWGYLVTAQFRPYLDDFLRQGPWQKASGMARVMVSDYIPFALPDRGGVLYSLEDPLFAPLMKAVDKVDLASVKRLLAEGADVNAQDQWGRTALGYACSTGRTTQEIVDTLLAAGADPNIADHEGVTPLYSAANVKSAEVVQALLRAGADPNHASPRGATALMVAAAWGATDKVRVLLDAGADPNHSDEYGRTALMSAAHHGYVRTVRVLLAAGADVNAKDEKGNTALSLAEGVGFIDVSRMLRKAVATH
jgi:ankyrin repeat protein